MKVAIGSDHRGFRIKELIKPIITQLGHELVDLGTNSEQPVDYPDIAYQGAMAVSKGQVDRAILICATGIGMCIAANKIPGVRAALCHDEFTASVSRGHNDSNVLCIPADQIGKVVLRRMVEAWLNTEFAGGRHERRLKKIAAIEQGIDPGTIT
ncbi:MAG: ribose 5-phosphate isomerase B [Sedimentisphaerales bacterium]|jgi:ribose 5-phosphate isomerase B|nr:ribose 5-phosphate isomerase B [Sedimentisphaerales bacterium]